MNLLLTLNLNDWLCDNARESLQAAAERWKCEYQEARVAYLPGYSPSFNKFAYLSDTSYDRIIYVDGDILIRSDAPSPLRLVPRNFAAAVPDVQSHHPPAMQKVVLETVHQCYFEKVGRYTVPVNGGFLITTPEFHSAMFQKLHEMAEGQLTTELERGGHYEQAMLNASLEAHGLRYLHERWNTIFPPVEDPVMHSFCYHFTGFGFDQRRDLLKTYQWRV